MKKIFIIILHWNGTRDTLECLASIRQLSTLPPKARLAKGGNSRAAGIASSPSRNLAMAEHGGDARQLSTLVVDNGSEEKLKVESGKLKVENFKIIRNKENLGFAEGNNVGIRYALDKGADYIVLLNNDTVVDKNLVGELLKVMEKDETVGLVAPKIYFAPGFEFHKDRYKKEERGKAIWYAGGVMDWNNVIGYHRGVDEVHRGQYDKQEETDFASGCCMMVKREVFDKVGLLDNKYFLYYEDSDFCQKVKGKGYRVMYVPKAFLWHKNARSAQGVGSSLQDYYITRNRLLFGMRYAPFRSRLALIKESISLLIQGRSWQKRGVLDFYLGRFGRGSYNLD